MHRTMLGGLRVALALAIAAAALGWAPAIHAQSPQWEPIDPAAWRTCADRGACAAMPPPNAQSEAVSRTVTERVTQEFPDRSLAGSVEYPFLTWIPRPQCRVNGGFRWYPAGTWHLLGVFASVWNGGSWVVAPVAMGWGFLTDARETCPDGAFTIPPNRYDEPPASWPGPLNPSPGQACGNDLSDGMIPGVPLSLALRDPITGQETPISAPYWVTHGPINAAPGGPPHRVIYAHGSPWAQGIWLPPVGFRAELVGAPERVRLRAAPGQQLVATFDLPRARFADPAVRSVTVGVHRDWRNMALVIQDLGGDRRLATPDDRFLFAQYFVGAPLNDDTHPNPWPLLWAAWNWRGIPPDSARVMTAIEDWPSADTYGLASGASYESIRFIHDQSLVFLDPPAFCRDSTACDRARLTRPEPGNPDAHNTLEGVAPRDPQDPDPARAGWSFTPIAPLRIAFPVQPGRAYRISAYTKIMRCQINNGEGVFHDFVNATQIIAEVEDAALIRGAVLDVSNPAQPGAANQARHIVTLEALIGSQIVMLDQQATAAGTAQFTLSARAAPVIAALRAQGRVAQDDTPVDLQVRLTPGQSGESTNALVYRLLRDFPATPPAGATAVIREPDRVRWTVPLRALQRGVQDGVTFFLGRFPGYQLPPTEDQLALEFLPLTAQRATDQTVRSTRDRANPTTLDWVYGGALDWRPTLRLRLPEPYVSQGYRIRWSITAWQVDQIGARALNQRLAPDAWHRVAWGKPGWSAPEDGVGVLVPAIVGDPQEIIVSIAYQHWLETPWGVASAPQDNQIRGTAQVTIHAPRVAP